MKTRLKPTALLVAGFLLSFSSMFLLSGCGGSGSSKIGSDSAAASSCGHKPFKVVSFFAYLLLKCK